MADVIVAGGGAAGMMCALTAAEYGAETILLEKNEKLGKKLFITGKGRCNLTNNASLETVFDNIVTNSRFMNSSLRQFSNEDTIRRFEEWGLRLTAERGGRIFPSSGHSSDVIKTLEKRLKSLNVRILLQTEVKEIEVRDGRVCGVKTGRGEFLPAKAVVIATGGLSYPSTGSTGDGYRFAVQAGISIEECVPSLVPMEVKEKELCRRLQGLSLKNTGITVKKGGKILYSDFGEMLFTHFGVSGPMILSASASLPKHVFEGEKPVLSIDLKPALDINTLDKRILRDFKGNENRNFGNSLNGLLPSGLIPVVVELSGISAEKKVHSVTRQERKKLTELLKDFPLTVTSLRGFEEAVITKGGVSVKEINPKTMEAKKCPGLYFVGEVLDVDAMTGGFNLQIAWSTGRACGKAVSADSAAPGKQSEEK